MEEAFGGWSAVLEAEQGRLMRQEAGWARDHKEVHIAAGEEVMVASHPLKGRKMSNVGGLHPTWIGPCRVIKVEGPNVVVELTAEFRGENITIHRSHVRPCGKSDEEWDFEWFDQLQAVPEDADIDAILDIDWTQMEGETRVMYLVSFRDWDVRYAEWVTTVNADNLIERYVRSLAVPRRKKVLKALKQAKEVQARTLLKWEKELAQQEVEDEEMEELP